MPRSCDRLCPDELVHTSGRYFLCLIELDRHIEEYVLTQLCLGLFSRRYRQQGLYQVSSYVNDFRLVVQKWTGIYIDLV